MTRLGGVDATFLYLETPETPMHVAGFTLYDPPPGMTGSFYDHFRTFFESRLHLIPIFLKKLVRTPLDLDHPAWAEDPDMDLDYHLRREILPAPGTLRQAEALISRLHSQLMDRTRPLWQFVIIEGFEDGRVALYSKVHHAAVDGGAGMIITKALYDVTPTPRVVEPPAKRARAPTAPNQRGVRDSINDLIVGMVRQQQIALRAAPEILGKIVNAITPVPEKNARLRDLAPKLKLPKLPQLRAPKTRFNRAIGGHRSYAARSISLPDAKKIAKATDTKLNDVVMAICGGALRKYLAEKKEIPDKPLLAFVPVSLREAGSDDLGNQVTGMICQIGTDIADPIARLASVKAAAVDAKAVVSAVRNVTPQDFTFPGAPILMTALASLYGRSGAANWLPSSVNVTISNVPGPPVPLYCAGAKVSALYPVSIPTHGVALNLTVQSYLDHLDFGVTGDDKSLPDPDRLGDLIVEAFEEMKTACAALVAQKAEAAAKPVAPEKPATREKPAAASEAEPARVAPPKRAAAKRVAAPKGLADQAAKTGRPAGKARTRGKPARAEVE